MKNDEKSKNQARAIFERLLKLITEVEEAQNQEERYLLSVKVMGVIKSLWGEIGLFTVHDSIKRGFPVGEHPKAKNMTEIDHMRNYLAFLINCDAPLDGFHKEDFIQALLALNHGEVHSILEPSRRGAWGQPYSVARLQCLAIEHVNFLHGRGMQKKAARLKVAKVYGIGAQENIETIRSWEVKAIKDFLGSEHADKMVKVSFKLGKMSVGMNIDDRQDKGLSANWEPGEVDWSGVGLSEDKDDPNGLEEIDEIPDDEIYGYAWDSHDPTSENIWENVIWELWFKQRKHCAKLAYDPKFSRPEYEEAIDIASFASHIMHYPLEICGRMYKLARSGKNIEFPKPWPM